MFNMLKKLKQFITQDFNEDFFEENQSTILFVANKWYLKWLIGLNSLPKQLKGKRIDKITPNSIHTVTGIKNDKYKVKGTFFTRPRFAEALAFNLSPFAYLMNNAQTKFQWRFSPVGAMAMLLLTLITKGAGIGFAFFGTTTSYYAGAGDGVCEIYFSGSGWDTTHDASSSNRVDYSNDRTGVSQHGLASSFDSHGGYFGFDRGFMPVDTSGLPDSISISEAKFYLYVILVEYQDNDSDAFINVVQTTSASTSSLVAADYSKCGDINDPDEGATRIDLDTFTNNAYNYFTLNSTGREWISTTGYTKLGLREGHDILDNPIVGGGGTYNSLGCRFSRYTGTGSDPYLEITYTEITTDIKSYNGLAIANVKSINGLAIADTKSINGLE